MEILIVDDEPDVVEFLRDYLAEKGHTVEVAIHGKKALECLKRKDYDLVLLDFNMPEMTGLELIKFIKKSHLKSKVIMMTGYDLMEEFIAASVGADEYVSKPFKLEKLSAMIDKYDRKP